MGRPRVKGERLLTLEKRLKNRLTKWQNATRPWYGAVGSLRIIEYASAAALWYHSGMVPVPIRWVMIRDPEKRFAPQALLCTNQKLSAEEILRAFVRRRQMEVTFQEVHAHLGLDGQRQWNDLAIARSTPLHLALFSIVALIANQLPRVSARASAWYAKEHLTFSDALAAVRRCLWIQISISASPSPPDMRKVPPNFSAHLIDLLCHAA